MTTPRRSYDSPLRREQTRLTRARILTVARDLLLARGYPGTTLDAIAEGAGVSVQTVYNAVGGKAKVLKAVHDAMLAGDDEPVPLSARPAYLAVLAETDPHVCLARYAELLRELTERILPLFTVVAAQAAGDHDLRAFVDTVEAERAAGSRALAEHLAARFTLREPLTVDEAAHVLWTLTSPEVAHRLVGTSGWPWARFTPWLARLLTETLISPHARPRDS